MRRSRAWREPIVGLLLFWFAAAPAARAAMPDEGKAPIPGLILGLAEPTTVPLTGEAADASADDDPDVTVGPVADAADDSGPEPPSSQPEAPSSTLQAPSSEPELPGAPKGPSVPGLQPVRSVERGAWSVELPTPGHEPHDHDTTNRIGGPRLHSPAPSERQPAQPRSARCPEPLELETGFSYEVLNHGRADWSGRYLDVRKVLGKRQAVYCRLESTDRYTRRDCALTLGQYLPVNRRCLAVTEASFSPTHRVVARWSAMGELQCSLSHGWDARVGLRRTEYPETSANLGWLVAERYWSRYRAGYTLYTTRGPKIGAAGAHRLSVSRYYGDRNSVDLGYALGDEADVLPSGEVRLSTVRSLNLSGQHWLRPRLAVTYLISVHQQGRLYTRNGVQIGLRQRF